MYSWTLFDKLLGSTTLKSALTLFLLFSLEILFFGFLSIPVAIVSTALMFVIVGPSIVHLPIYLSFIYANGRTGDWLLPIGCTRDENGEVWCM
jgi:succinate-acetate transporter protein